MNSLHLKGAYDLYLTGSNAFLLSSDLATLFTGRYIEIHVFPFSFQEYCEYHEGTADQDKLFDAYVLEGGMPGSSEFDRMNYLREACRTILTRDLVQKYKIADELTLESLSDTSPDKVSNLLRSKDVQTSHVTAGKYIKYLCTSFLFYDIKRYDLQGKKYLETSSKYYLADTGLGYAVLGSRNLDYGRMYENLVCLELLRRGYEVYVGKPCQKEIDFVAKKGSEQLYIQVSDDISREGTFARETAPLLRIRDGYPKLVIARTHHPVCTYEGIRVYDLASWLLTWSLEPAL